MLRAHFQKREEALEILDTELAGYYILPRYYNLAAGPVSPRNLVQSGIQGNGDIIMTLFHTTDRRQEKSLVNLGRITHFNPTMIDVPEDISNKIDEFNNLDSESDTYEQDYENLALEIHSYFSRQ